MVKKLKRILVHIPKEFLKEFDEETLGIYASRNEAIRAGMILISARRDKNEYQLMNGEVPLH